MKMHEHEVDIDAALVRRLLRRQHPQWADLPLRRVDSAGTDNAMYRLGDDLAVRLPRIDWAVDQVAKEQRWLPELSGQLPLRVPLPVATGAPDAEFPNPWGVVEWLSGDMATPAAVANSVQVAEDLAAFICALQRIEATGGPRHSRGGPVRLADAAVRRSIDQLQDEIDADAFTAAWEKALTVPDYDGPPVWFHGDLSHLNLLTSHDRLTAVLDWGACGVGDPAIDTLIAWGLFDPQARRAYRQALDVDDASWERGKGWVLTGIVGVTYYRDTNPVLVADKIRGIKAVLGEFDG